MQNDLLQQLGFEISNIVLDTTNIGKLTQRERDRIYEIAKLNPTLEQLNVYRAEKLDVTNHVKLLATQERFVDAFYLVDMAAMLAPDKKGKVLAKIAGMQLAEQADALFGTNYSQKLPGTEKPIKTHLQEKFGAYRAYVYGQIMPQT